MIGARRLLSKMLTQCAYWIGLAVIVYGCWLIYRPLGFVMGGLFLILIAFLIDREMK